MTTAPTTARTDGRTHDQELRGFVEVTKEHTGTRVACLRVLMYEHARKQAEHRRPCYL